MSKTTHDRARNLAENWGVEHATLDPKGPDGPVRLHLHPGSNLLFINGQHILPVRHGEAMLLRIFMQELKKVYHPGQETSDVGIRKVLKATAERMHELYPEVKDHERRFARDLGYMQKVIFAVARGVWPEELRGMKPITMAQYAKHMTGPFRMDLAVWPTRIGDKWACNNACGACYAMTGEAMQVDADEMLSTQEWKDVLDILWKEAGTSQVSFTGGEPTLRDNLVELIAYAQEFTTRLNTNGRKLADLAFCQQLKRVSLDVAQITVYSYDASIHNALVGVKGAWGETMQGIRNAVSVGLEVSVNIPLVDANVRGLAETIEYLYRNLGVRYFTCSGLLPAGGAKKVISSGHAAEADVLHKELRRAKAVTKRLNLELDFTSPGVLSLEQLRELGFTNPPVCGAGLGNMAISPTGKVLPCQSWVHDLDVFGSILEIPWKNIWNSKTCKRIRKKAVANEGTCPLATEVK